jgi:prenyltransferase beta subunit
VIDAADTHRKIFPCLLLTYRVFRSFGVGIEQSRLLATYLKADLKNERSDQSCLQAAVRWLSQAQDICENGGVSAAYTLGKGWNHAYPETSGYILATFLAYAELYGDPSYVERAIRIGNWETEIQTPSGGVLSNLVDPDTRVFNTGQVILGWCALYEKTEKTQYLLSATRAADYLCRLQEPDGSWVKDTYCGPRTYHARVDWALLRVARLTGKKAYAAAAEKNLRWVLAQQKENGWFSLCGFHDDPPNMHVTSYTLRGLLECHCTGLPEILSLHLLPQIRRTADVLCSLAERSFPGLPRGMLPSSFDRQWNSSDSSSCLTGNAQFACFLYRMAQITGDKRYAGTASLVLAAVKTTQLFHSLFCEIDGAIAGSYPIHTGYMRCAYPNWATKFYADALMMKLFYDRGFSINA